jgi:hypothetical protein
MVYFFGRGGLLLVHLKYIMASFRLGTLLSGIGLLSLLNHLR